MRPRFPLARTLALVVPLAAAPLAAPLAAQPADTTAIKRTPLFTRNDAVVAAGFVVSTVAISYADRHFALRLQDSTTQANRFFRNSATGFRTIAEPGALIIGATLYTVGRVGKYERLADLGLHGTEAIVVGTGVNNVLKFLAGRARPFVNDSNPHDWGIGRGYRKEQYRSFPSGHTLTGFAAAAAVTSETTRWWPRSTWYVAPVMYGGATLIGLSRMYNNKHWASDVAMGAAMGTFSGLKVVRYHHSHPNNRVDRWLLGASIVPAAGGGTTVALTILPR